jgi:fatty acid desaturase
VLRYKADRRTLVFIASYFVILAAAWRAPFDLRHWPLTAGLVVLLMIVAWLNAVITHNVVHCPVWKNRTLNKLTQVALSLTYGFAVSDYIPGHNLSHHRYTQTRKDVMRTSKVQYRWHLLNLLMFFFYVGFDVVAANGKYSKHAKGRAEKWHRQRWIEVAVTWSAKAALIAIDWRKGILFVLIPHLWAVWGITTVNLLQHDGAEGEHPYNHSRNFVGKIFNWFTFNNGFHGMHHMEPGLHWSLLRKAHEERLKPFMDPRLDEPSLAVYLFRTFVWPGKRRMFDGSPMHFIEEGPDLDWIGGDVIANPADAEPSAAE